MTRRLSDLHDVQGIVRGYGHQRYPVGRFFLIGITSSECGRQLLTKLIDDQWIATAAAWEGGPPQFRLNVAFSFPGLQAMKLPFPILDSFPVEFKAGMRRRAVVNGDREDSAPVNWDPVWADDKVHIWLGLYAISDQVLASIDKELRDVLARYNCELLGEQNVAHLKRDGELPERPIEHFGFVDNISNPPIAGLNRDGNYSGGRLDDQGQWDAMAAGEFLLGSYQDEILERPKSLASEILSTNGTFMVYRKLEQDVEKFREYTREEANRLGMEPEMLAAKMIGRHQDGTPLIKPKRADHGGRGELANDFLFGDDAEGAQCPLGSHIRRTNPRDTFGFGTKLVNRHRMLRRGIPYGEYVPVGENAAEKNPVDGQGLIFLSLSASIERQFEFVQQQWVNYGDSLFQGSDKDPITGSNFFGYGHFKIPGNATKPLRICTAVPQFVTTKGGEYFFMPGIEALGYLATGRYLGIPTTPETIAEHQARRP